MNLHNAFVTHYMTTVCKGSTNLEQRIWVVKLSDLSTGVWRGFEAIDKPTRSGTLPEVATNATRKVRHRNFHVAVSSFFYLAAMSCIAAI